MAIEFRPAKTMAIKITPTSHLVGLTKYKRKRRCPPMSTTAGNNRGRAPRLISYCPQCEHSHAANPEQDVHVSADVGKKIGKCAFGHVWEIV